MTTKPATPGLMIVELGIGLTNAELLDKTRATKAARESGRFSNVVCCIAGFDRDPRELDAIPECRAFAQRCVDQGVIAFLDACASADPRTNGGLGAAEVVWLARGVRPAGRIDAAMADLVNDEIRKSREAAEAALGPFAPGRG